MNRQNAQQLLRMKLLQFYEDVRPAYYGTWTKKSKVVTGRTPFARDEQSMDYEHDSEAEWEPEGEGEDIQSGEEDEDDPTADLADGDDAGWLVPEGYLSDSEGVDTDDEDYKKSRSQGVTLRPASRKHLTIRQVVIGPLYEDVDGHVEDDALKPYETKMIIDCGDSYDPFYVEPVSAAANAGKGSSFTEHHTTELVNIIAGKAVENIPDLVSEAKSNWLLRDVPKRQIEARIKDLAVKEKRGSDTKPAWYIKETN
ncbi:chromatin assembly factor 1 subunit A-domain-containing protein [Radiomyces spectabilis]|uniref:chromatin assembly factor 1 subunit A-domain-containing protein n=1 Tax=Radiomyces spectabilis TaxID=64574 RepID=UPI00221E410F|nr:chromatin assembly factor 1 subunit A-domain-containing protein [Radiomyces spectabilis]KAI8368204.1 chromatin assembly factor 1 subunit A-domain-containing protein [Radiomyces spectabilis]